MVDIDGYRGSGPRRRDRSGRRDEEWMVYVIFDSETNSNEIMEYTNRCSCI